MSDSDSYDEEHKTASKTRHKSALTPHVGLNAKQHEQEAHLRAKRNELAERGYLETAEGGVPTSVQLLQEISLSTVPGSAGDTLHDKLVYEVSRKNERNALKRRIAILRTWTKIYTHLSQSCRDTCPALFEELYALCRMDIRGEGFSSGQFDGPLAWRMYVGSLTPAARSKDDRDFYEAALTLMKANRLPENCTGSQYLDKAIAFTVHIVKNVPRPYTDELAGEELVGFMPEALGSDGRRLLAELRRSSMLGDLRYVAHQCEEVVENARDPSKPTPSAVTYLPQQTLHGKSLKEVSNACGMAFRFRPEQGCNHEHTPALNAFAPSGGGNQWCPKCNKFGKHPGRNGEDYECFANPNVQLTYPPSIAKKPEVTAEYDRLRKANADRIGVTYTPVSQPSEDKMRAYTSRPSRPAPRRAPAGGARKQATSGAAVRKDFMASVVDFSDPMYTSKAGGAAVIDSMDGPDGEVNDLVDSSTLLTGMAIEASIDVAGAYEQQPVLTEAHMQMPDTEGSEKYAWVRPPSGSLTSTASLGDMIATLKDARTPPEGKGGQAGANSPSAALQPSDKVEDVLAMLDEATDAAPTVASCEGDKDGPTWCVAFYPDGTVSALPIDEYDAMASDESTIPLMKCDSEEAATAMASAIKTNEVTIQDEAKERHATALAQGDPSESGDPSVPTVVLDRWSVHTEMFSGKRVLYCTWIDDHDAIRTTSPIQWLSTAESTVVTKRSTYSLGKMSWSYARARQRWGLDAEFEYRCGDHDSYTCPWALDLNDEGEPAEHTADAGTPQEEAMGAEAADELPAHHINGISECSEATEGEASAAVAAEAEGDSDERDAVHEPNAPDPPPPAREYPHRCECRECEYMVYQNEGTAEQPITCCDFCFADVGMPCQCTCNGCTGASEAEGAAAPQGDAEMAEAQDGAIVFLPAALAPFDGSAEMSAAMLQRTGFKENTPLAMAMGRASEISRSASSGGESDSDYSDYASALEDVNEHGHAAPIYYMDLWDMDEFGPPGPPTGCRIMHTDEFSGRIHPVCAYAAHGDRDVLIEGEETSDEEDAYHEAPGEAEGEQAVGAHAGEGMATPAPADPRHWMGATHTGHRAREDALLTVDERAVHGCANRRNTMAVQLGEVDKPLERSTFQPPTRAERMPNNVWGTHGKGEEAMLSVSKHDHVRKQEYSPSVLPPEAALPSTAMRTRVEARRRGHDGHTATKAKLGSPGEAATGGRSPFVPTPLPREANIGDDASRHRSSHAHEATGGEADKSPTAAAQATTPTVEAAAPKPADVSACPETPEHLENKGAAQSPATTVTLFNYYSVVCHDNASATVRRLAPSGDAEKDMAIILSDAPQNALVECHGPGADVGLPKARAVVELALLNFKEDEALRAGMQASAHNGRQYEPLRAEVAAATDWEQECHASYRDAQAATGRLGQAIRGMPSGAIPRCGPLRAAALAAHKANQGPRVGADQAPRETKRVTPEATPTADALTSVTWCIALAVGAIVFMMKGAGNACAAMMGVAIGLAFAPNNLAQHRWATEAGRKLQALGPFHPVICLILVYCVSGVQSRAEGAEPRPPIEAAR